MTFSFSIAAPPQGVRSCALSPNLDHLHITYYYSYLQSFAIVFSFLLEALFSMSLSVYNLCIRWSREESLECFLLRFWINFTVEAVSDKFYYGECMCATLMMLSVLVDSDLCFGSNLTKLRFLVNKNVWVWISTQFSLRWALPTSIILSSLLLKENTLIWNFHEFFQMKEIVTEDFLKERHRQHKKAQIVTQIEIFEINLLDKNHQISNIWNICNANGFP